MSDLFQIVKLSSKNRRLTPVFQLTNMQLFQVSAIALLLVSFFAQTDAINARKLAKESNDLRRAKNGVRGAKQRLSQFNKNRKDRWSKMKANGVSNSQLNAVHKVHERIEDNLEKKLDNAKAMRNKERADVNNVIKA